jgi:hypothetical protein
MWPIFVFGTGRCGSTHIQRLITLSTCCWIWGEHEGFLAPLLESVRRYETSQGLDRNVFRGGPRSDDQLISDMSLGSERLSWLNRLDKGGFQPAVAALVDRMFRSRVPAGWTEWGFKEILYGLDNSAPETLLRLFPTATAVFTFRDPKSTIESMIKTWSPELLGGPPSLEKLSEIYKIRMRRWRKIVSYFLTFRGSDIGRIVFLSSDKLSLPLIQILQVLRLSLTRAMPEGLYVTNRGLNNWPQWASEKFDELFAADEPECRDLFARACAQSDADFAFSPNGTP